MPKKDKFKSITNLPEVSDEEYRRLAAEASAKMRSVARKRVPRSERRKAAIEPSDVSDDEYRRLTESARSRERRSLLPRRKRRPSTELAETAVDVSEEEYRRLANEMMDRSERDGQRQDQIVGFFRRLANPITVAIVILGAISIYFLVQHKRLSIF